MNLTYAPTIAEVIEKLEAGNPLPTLVPQKAWSTELTDTLQSTSVDELFQGESVKNTTFGDAIKSGLLLWNDALDESHNISQGLANQNGQLLARHYAPPRAGLQQCEVLVRQSRRAPHFPTGPRTGTRDIE